MAAWGRVAYGLSGVPPPPGAAALLGGGRDLLWPWGGVEDCRPLCPSRASRGPEGGEWRGERGGGVALWFLAALLRFPGPDPRRLRRAGL